LSVLRTDTLFKSFGNLVVTKDVTLAFDRGERHAIIGPNGAGKTSFVHQLGGQLAPTSGKIYLGDVEVTNYRPERRCALGIARTFQKNNLFPTLSVLENVRLAVQARHGNPLDPFRPAVSLTRLKERANELLEQVMLHGISDMEVRHMSYGEQRQLEIAVALASEPKILLLDEPTSGMSPAETTRMMNMIKSLPKDLCIILVEHDMQVVFSLADRVTVLHYGEVLATGAPQEISANEHVQSVYLGAHH
jgi:branched-chain amino acid transport system ATP-binding protein